MARVTLPPDKSFDTKLEKLMSQLDNIKELFMTVKRNEDELLDVLTVIDGHIRNLDKNKFDQEIEKICQRIKESTEKLLPKGDIQGGAREDLDSSGVTSHDEKWKKVLSDPSSSQQHNELHDQDLNQKIQVSYEDLKDDLMKHCLFSLSFP